MRSTSFVVMVLVLCQLSFAQTEQIEENNSLFIIPEFIVGITAEANEGFPDRNLQTGFLVSFGNYHSNNKQEWAARLNYPKTGITLGYIDFGNSEKLGQAYSFLPFVEFRIKKRLNLYVAMGASYMNNLYDVNTNPFNKAITTSINWSFKSFAYYDVLHGDKIDWRLGLGYFHHSNGHTRLPNQGLNSFLASVSANISTDDEHKLIDKPIYEKSSQTYFSARADYGINVLSEIFNDKKPVYTVAFSAGKIINKTFKLGGGIYYRFYQHYYDYIKNDETLVAEDFPIFKENPFGYASNFGFFVTAELLLGHIGFEFDLGFNIHKPFYQIDWILNEGYEFDTAQGEHVVVLGELDWYYEIKRTISSRMGLKYYLINNNKSPQHNLFFGAHINGNLGQADFTGFSLGYVYRLEKKE